MQSLLSRAAIGPGQATGPQQDTAEIPGCHTAYVGNPHPAEDLQHGLAGRALGRLGWGAALWVVLAMVGRRFRPAQLRIPPRRPDVQRPVRHLGLLRAALYALALLLLILGVGNQGMRDVLVKAIQICTECIGLG